MKATKISLMAALIAGSVLAYSPALRAQDANTNTPSSQDGRRAGRRGAAGMKERMDKMAADLKLTDEQKTKVEALFKSQAEKGRAIREDSSLTDEQKREKAKALREGMNKQMKAILTAEQFAQWEKMRPQGRGGRRNAPPQSGNETK